MHRVHGSFEPSPIRVPPPPSKIMLGVSGSGVRVYRVYGSFEPSPKQIEKSDNKAKEAECVSSSGNFSLTLTRKPGNLFVSYHSQQQHYMGILVERPKEISTLCLQLHSRHSDCMTIGLGFLPSAEQPRNHADNTTQREIGV